MAAGENVTCTYTNTKCGSITVKKLTDPAGDAAKFDFSGDLTGPIGDGESIGPKSVVPGTYYTTETVPGAWALTKIQCSDTDSSGSTTTGKATFKVAAGENVTCTYTNSRLPTLTVKKHVVNDNGGTAVAGNWDIHVKSGPSTSREARRLGRRPARRTRWPRGPTRPPSPAGPPAADTRSTDSATPATRAAP